MTRVVDQFDGGRRSSRHDEMCAAVATHRERLFPRYAGEVRARVEAPLGRGFCDVLAWTEAPPGERDWCIVEVKTNAEQCSAGDVIRQLKFYRKHLRRPNIRLALVVENTGSMPSAMLTLLLHEEIDVLPIWYFEEAA